MRQSGVNIRFGWHPVILEYLLHNQAAIPDSIESANLEIRLGNVLVSGECQWESLWAEWIRLICLCLKKSAAYFDIDGAIKQLTPDKVHR
jgi:hypothetical protein